MAERRVELEYVFDRLGELQRAQAYQLLVPQRRRIIEKGPEDENRGDLCEGVLGQAEGGTNNRQSDGGPAGVRQGARAIGSGGMGF